MARACRVHVKEAFGKLTVEVFLYELRLSCLDVPFWRRIENPADLPMPDFSDYREEIHNAHVQKFRQYLGGKIVAYARSIGMRYESKARDGSFYAGPPLSGMELLSLVREE